MTHRFLHVGDVHLQSSHPRNADRLASLDQIVRYADQVRDDLAACLIPGDLFHTKPTTQDRNDLAARLIALATVAPVVLAYGNHDEAASLDLFAKLQTIWPIFVVSRPEVLRFQSPAGVPVACFVLPWPHRAGLVAAGAVPATIGDEAHALLDPIVMLAADELEQAAAAGAVPLMIAHATIGGAVASTGQPQAGTGIELDAALLARVGPVYKGFSHIHKHQVVHGAVYAGSICRMDFGEQEDKGFIEVEYQRDGSVWQHRWGFRLLDIPRQLRINGQLTAAGFAPDAGEDADSLRQVVGADVRVRYRYRRADHGTLDLGPIEVLCAGARSLKLEPQPIHEAEVRAPEVVAATTLEGKVQAYCARMQVAWTDGLAAKVAALHEPQADASAATTAVA